MIDFFKSLQSLLKLEKIHTDNNVFKLHYRVTVALLLGFSILLTSKQYFGEPIDCDVEQRKDVIDTFCWIYGTFIVKNNLEDKKVPGLGISHLDELSAINKQSYYQWVCLVFGIQAIFFYLPKYLWKTWEGGRLRLLINDLGGPLVSPNWNNAAKESLVRYLLNGEYSYNIYTVRYCFCELLNFLNVIAQIYFMDWFVTGNFSSYGIAHASFKLVNPMNSVFPKLAKCLYFRYGPSGGIESHDALCILPLNVLNEKFFLILWYWLFFLLFLSLLCLVYRAMFLFIPKFRVYLLRAQTRKLDNKRANLIVKTISYGDFFVLYKVGKNVNPVLYKELIISIYERLSNKQPVNNKNYVCDVDEL